MFWWLKKNIFEKTLFSKIDLLSDFLESWNHFVKWYCFKLVKPKKELNL